MFDPGSEERSVVVSLREYSLRAWEQGQELIALLEGLRVSGGTFGSAPSGSPCGVEVSGLLMQYGAVREATERLSRTVSGLGETLSSLRVIARVGET